MINTSDATPLENNAPVNPDHTMYYKMGASPFSNFYNCKLQIDGWCYSCIEQYFKHVKAALGKDTLSAYEIIWPQMHWQKHHYQQIIKKQLEVVEMAWNMNRKTLFWNNSLEQLNAN